MFTFLKIYNKGNSTCLHSGGAKSKQKFFFFAKYEFTITLTLFTNVYKTYFETSQLCQVPGV